MSFSIGIISYSGVAPCTYTNTEVCTWSTASGVTDGSTLSDLDTYISSLKTAGIWTALDVLHGLFFGSLNASKYNIKDPANFVASQVGSVTWASTGVTGNGTTGYLRTGYIPSASAQTTASGAFGLYCSGNQNRDEVDMGSAQNNGDARGSFLITRYAGVAYGEYGNGSYANSVSSSNSTGLWLVNRETVSTVLYKGDTAIKSTTELAILSDYEFFIMSLNEGGTPFTFSSKPYSMYFMFNRSLTSGEITDWKNATTTFVTARGAN